MKSTLALLFLVGCGDVVDKQDGTITVAVAQPSSFVRQGDSVQLDVTVTRVDVDAAIDITVTDLATGVTAAPLQIAEGATTGTLALAAAATATQGIAHPTITATVADDPDITASAPPVRLLVGGEPGTLDTSFAMDGTFTPQLGGLAMASRGLAFTPAGLVVTGFVVANPPQAITVRVGEDGSLDPDFGSGGFVSTGVGQLAEGIAVAVAPNGDSIVSGIAGGSGSECEFGVFRYDGAGALVPGFGASGVATLDPGAGCAEWHNVAIAADGSIIAGGTFFAGTGFTPNGRAVRYSPNGVQDPNFAVNEPNVNVEGSVIQADGKLVMVGGIGADFWVARFNVDGSRDPGFGSGGIVQTDFNGQSDSANGVIALPNNKLLVIGTSLAGGVTTIALARYNANGSLDVTFGSGGTVLTTTQFESRGSAVVLAGTTLYFVGREPSTKRPAVARILDDGTVDTAFGTAGVTVIDFGVAGVTSNTGGFGVAVDVDGRVLVAGDVGPGGGQVMAIARLWF